MYRSDGYLQHFRKFSFGPLSWRCSLSAPSALSCRAPLIAGELGDGFLGAIVVDERFASRGCSDQCGDGGIVEWARWPKADLVEPSDGVISEQRIGQAHQR